MRKLLALLTLALLFPSFVHAEVGMYNVRRGGVTSSAQVIGLWGGTCNGSSYMRGDGQCATPAGSGDMASNTATSVVGEVAQFADTTGKLFKRSTITGVGVFTSGVMAAYAGVTCTNQFLRVLSASAAGTCAAVSMTADVSGILPSANGGTGNGFAKLTGPTTSEKSFALPDASATILTTNALVTAAQGGTNNGFTQFSGPAASTKTFTLPNATSTILTDNAVVTTAQGGTGLGAQSDDTILVSNGTIWQAKAVPDCVDTGTNHLNYTASTNAFSCGTAGGAGSGDVTAASTFGTDNRIIRSDGTGKGVQSTGITVADTTDDVSGIGSITLKTGQAIRTTTTTANTVLLQAYDVDGAAYTTFGTLTSGNTPTFDLNTNTTIGGNPIAQFTDPNVDCMMYWRDSDGSFQCVTVSTGLSFTTGTLTATGLTSASIDTSAELKAILTDETGSGGAVVFATGPTIDSPVFTTKFNPPSVTAFPGAPSTGDVVIVTDDSVAGACDSAAGSAVSLCRWSGAAWLKLGDGTAAGGTLASTDIDTSAELKAIVTDETGSGALVFATSPTLVTPLLGTPTSGVLTNTTGYTIANLSGAGTGVLTALGVANNSAGGYSPIDGTATFTNKTLDCAATGNVCKQKSYIYLTHPHLCDGTGAVIGTTATAIGYGHALFSNSADETVNYCEYYIQVPEDLDTGVALRGRIKVLLAAGDTATQRYVLSSVSVADSAVPTAATLANGINIDFAGDASGATGDVETSAWTTLTSWAGALTAGQTWRIRFARDGNATQDGSTQNSTELGLVIEYGVTQ